MRIYVTGTLLCVMALAASAQDHLATLGISEGRAREAVFDSFMSDAVSIAGKPAAFIGMPPAARVALVNFALNLARTFAESDEFKRRYADHRARLHCRRLRLRDSASQAQRGQTPSRYR